MALLIWNTGGKLQCCFMGKGCEDSSLFHNHTYTLLSPNPISGITAILWPWRKTHSLLYFSFPCSGTGYIYADFSGKFFLALISRCERGKDYLEIIHQSACLGLELAHFTSGISVEHFSFSFCFLGDESYLTLHLQKYPHFILSPCGKGI